MTTYNNPSVGDIIRVTITSIKPDLGAVAKMPIGVDGVRRLRDMFWANQSVTLSSLSEGDVLDVKVIKELPDGKLNLAEKIFYPIQEQLKKVPYTRLL